MRWLVPVGQVYKRECRICSCPGDGECACRGASRLDAWTERGIRGRPRHTTHVGRNLACCCTCDLLCPSYMEHEAVWDDAFCDRLSLGVDQRSGRQANSWRRLFDRAYARKTSFASQCTARDKEARRRKLSSSNGPGSFKRVDGHKS